jgi:hypothetical protein
MLALGRKLGFTINRSASAGEFDLYLTMSNPSHFTGKEKK